ncbi:hypothetical protein ACJX0J_040022, partial [Zea mays]
VTPEFGEKIGQHAVHALSLFFPSACVREESLFLLFLGLSIMCHIFIFIIGFWATKLQDCYLATKFTQIVDECYGNVDVLHTQHVEDSVIGVEKKGVQEWPHMFFDTAILSLTTRAILSPIPLEDNHVCHLV